MTGPRDVSFTRSIERTISGAVRTIRMMAATKSPVALHEAYQEKSSSSPTTSAAGTSAFLQGGWPLSARLMVESFREQGTALCQKLGKDVSGVRAGCPAQSIEKKPLGNSEIRTTHGASTWA